MSQRKIITAAYQEINSQIEEMVEDLGCPRRFAINLLKSIADNFKDEIEAVKNESSYPSRHASTPQHEKGAEEIVSKHETEAKKASSDLFKCFNKNIS